MKTFADRLKTVQEYYFSKKLQEVASLISSGKDIVNLGIGSPDLPPPEKAVTALQKALENPTAHQYKSYRGIPQLREAISVFYQNHFQVNVDATQEVLPLMGSKEGIMHISMAFLNEGDGVLIPNPGYPTYTSVTKLLQATPIYYDLDPNKNWQANLQTLSKIDLSRVKIMWLNYPNMPTGAPASEKYYKELIDFATAHQIILVNDNPYAFILNDTPLSILKLDGAKNVAIELNSLSKTFHMAGWRMGMVLAKSEFINAILKVKSNMDSGMFYPLQMGAITALKTPSSWLKKQSKIYEKRRLKIWELLDLMGCQYRKNYGGMFVWAKLSGTTTAEKMTDKMLYEYDTFITPGTIFGSGGKGYVRLSLCVCEKDIEKVINRLKNNPLK